ncbi:hypothetical protein ACR6HW_14190 [Fusibacter sp. JL298sf-3]
MKLNYKSILCLMLLSLCFVLVGFRYNQLTDTRMALQATYAELNTQKNALALENTALERALTGIRLESEHYEALYAARLETDLLFHRTFEGQALAGQLSDRIDLRDTGVHIDGEAFNLPQSLAFRQLDFGFLKDDTTFYAHYKMPSNQRHLEARFVRNDAGWQLDDLEFLK